MDWSIVVDIGLRVFTSVVFWYVGYRMGRRYNERLLMMAIRELHVRQGRSNNGEGQESGGV